jgi:tetratricopeptide (TPR) repeat protein
MPLLEDIYQLRKAKEGTDHADTWKSMDDLANGYQATRKFDLAVSILERSLAKRKEKLGPTHRDTFVNKFSLISATIRAGQSDRATALIQEILAESRSRLRPGSPQLGGVLAVFGEALAKSKAYAAAEPILRECLAIRQKLAPETWSTFNARSLLGGALLGQKKYEEAEPLLSSSYDGLRKTEAQTPWRAKSNATNALDRLVQLYDAWDKPAEAAKRIQMIDEWCRQSAGKIVHPTLIPNLMFSRLRHFARTRDAAGCRQTAEMWEQLKRTDDGSLYNAACCRAITSSVYEHDPKTPMAVRTRLAGEEADRAMSWLKQAVLAGFNDVANLATDKDLSALRKRDDFKKLFSELEKKFSLKLPMTPPPTPDTP